MLVITPEDMLAQLDSEEIVVDRGVKFAQVKQSPSSSRVMTFSEQFTSSASDEEADKSFGGKVSLWVK